MELSNGERLFHWPLDYHVITAGWTYSDGSAHNADDFRTNQGGYIVKPVYAAEAATVDQVQEWNGADKSGMQSYGTMVRLRHADYNGLLLQTRYAHLSSVCVSKGDTVKEGQIIGYTGQTGNVSGAHLHFEVILNGTRVNPLNWLDSDFTCANETVRKHLGAYKSVVCPEEKYKLIIDVSKYQGDIDWAKVPYPAIIRVGYRGYGSGACTVDEKFEQNISGAIAAGKLYGFYFFSQAVSLEEASSEAIFASNLIGGRGSGLPLFIDCEWSNPNHDGRADTLSKEERTSFAEAFCETAKDCGFVPGVYTFTSFANSNIDYAALATKYIGWLADTRVKYDTTLPRHIHQYGQGEVPGISGIVDLNHIIKEVSDEEAKPVNQLQKICIVDANDPILERAKEAGLPFERRTCYLIGPASNGDAMALWLKAQAEGKPYFSSYTEV